MKLPLIWLKDYIDTKKSPKEISNIYTSIGHMLDEPIKDNMLSLEVRQNRPDCLSVIGLARELSAVLETSIKEPQLAKLPEITSQKNYLDVKNGNKINRFIALHIKVKIGKTQENIVERLKSYGIPSINNIVDLTNFVMVELGQPMHAFDISKINGRKLIIRQAKENEKFTTLLGTTINLNEKDIIIADNKLVLGLAGIIGGNYSKAVNDSKELLVEAANYNQASIRQSSRKHSVRTEASTRLEKYLSPKLPEIATQRFVQLLSDNNIDFEILGYEDYSKEFESINIKFNTKELKRIGGVDIDNEKILKILSQLNFDTEKEGDGLYSIKVPYYRTDIECGEDIIEEILRINGYENIPSNAINLAPPLKEITSGEYILENAIRDSLVKLGFDEHITEPIIRSTKNPNEITLENPLNKDKDTLRTEIFQTLKQVIKTYKKNKRENIKIFEVGKYYLKDNNNYQEHNAATAIVEGNYTFKDLKGYMECLLKDLNITYYEIKPKGSEAYIMQKELCLGKIKRNDFTLYISALSKALKSSRIYVETDVRNEIIEDITIEVPLKTYIGPIINNIKSINKLIHSVELVDGLEKKDLKAITFRITYKNPSKSITDKDVLPIKQKISSLLKSINQ